RSRGWRRDVWAVLHPPYTAWHLSYVLIGASLAPALSLQRLLATLLAFFFAVGISAHALDALRGRPLQTELPGGALWTVAIAAASAAYAISFGQRALSTPARLLRRKTRSVSGTLTLSDGSETHLDEPALLRPLELALRAFSWGVVLLAVGLVAARLV